LESSLSQHYMSEI